MKLFFIREKENIYGGAENYLSRLLSQLNSQRTKFSTKKSPFPRFLPSWFRVILFNIYLCFTKKNDVYFSLERIICPDIYRAGDGVHKVFLKHVKKSRFNPLHAIYIFIEKRCFNKSKFIIANSKMVKKDIESAYCVDPSKIKVIYNGINPPRVEITNREVYSLRTKFNLKSDRKLIIFVGNGFQRKGLQSFLGILSKLKQDEFDAVVIGEDKNIDFYKNIATDLGLSNVQFFGKRADVDLFYFISDFVILPTKYDPFSNVVLEAMSYKNVVITTKQNGASEILDPDLIMSDHNDFSIATKISELLDDKNKMDLIKNNNFLISKNFSIARNARETIELIRKVLNE